MLYHLIVPPKVSLYISSIYSKLKVVILVYSGVLHQSGVFQGGYHVTHNLSDGI